MKRILSLCLALSAWSASAQAQGLLWSLPEDKQAIRYEGSYSQTIRRPDSTAGDLVLEWRQNTTIKSVGREEAEFRGELQPCRWIEIRTETGKTAEGVLDAGPGGIRMYRLLIPESAFRGTLYEPVADNREIFVEYLPVVRGLRRIGDEAAQEIESGAFQLYPVTSLIRHYRELSESEVGQNVVVPLGDFASTRLRGQMVMERPDYRSTNRCDVYRSDAIPFGVVKWTATTTVETKVSTEPRSAFREEVVLKEELQAVSLEGGAESDFLLN